MSDHSETKSQFTRRSMLSGPARLAALAGIGGLAGGTAIGALGGGAVRPAQAQEAGHSANVEPGQLDEHYVFFSSG